jgi:hypothetical protein
MKENDVDEDLPQYVVHIITSNILYQMQHFKQKSG